MSEAKQTFFGRKWHPLMSFIPNNVKCVFIIYVQVLVFYEKIYIDYTLIFIKNSLSISHNLKPFMSFKYVVSINEMFPLNIFHYLLILEK